MTEKRRNIEKYIAILLVGVTISLLIYNLLFSEIISHDTITLTATGEMNLQAEGNEVWISSIIVDGKYVDMDREIEQINGRWIIENDRIGWISYGKGDDITNSVTLEIPVGKNRELILEQNMWRGNVEIVQFNEKQAYDLYSKDSGTKNISLEDSESALLKERQLQIYKNILLSIVFSLIIIALFLLLKNLKVFKYTTVKRWYVYGIAFLVIFSVALMIYYSKFSHMVWGDDWIGIGSIGSDNLIEAIRINVWSYDMSPPLFNIIAFCFAKILPHTISGIMIIPQTFTALTILSIGLMIKEIFGKKLSIIATIIAATSAPLFLTAGYEIRPYSMFCMLTALSLLIYVKKIKLMSYSKKYLALQTLLFTLLLYTHYFGIVLVGLYFLCDVFMYIHKKCNIKNIFSYILSFLLFLPWIGIVLIKSSNQVLNVAKTHGAYVKIKYNDVKNTIMYLTNANALVYGILILVVVVLLVNVYKKYKTNEIWKNDNIMAYFSVFTILIMISFIILIGPIINMYRNRYFLCLYPYVIIVWCYGINCAIKFIERHISNISIYSSISLVCLIFLFSLVYLDKVMKNDMLRSNKIVHEQNNGTMLYPEIISVLEKKEDIYNAETAIFVPTTNAYDYLMNTSKAEKINIEYQHSFEQIENYDVIYYAYYDWQSINYLAENEIIKNKYAMTENDDYFKIVKYERISNTPLSRVNTS